MVNMNLWRRNIIIDEIIKFDEWFAILVKENAYEVTEKIDYLLQIINLENLDENCFQTLLQRIHQFYKERLDPESIWESMTDFNYQIKSYFNYRNGKFETKIIEKYEYEDSDDNENEKDEDNDDSLDLSIKMENVNIQNEDFCDVKLACDDKHFLNQLKSEEHRNPDQIKILKNASIQDNMTCSGVTSTDVMRNFFNKLLENKNMDFAKVNNDEIKFHLVDFQNSEDDCVKNNFEDVETNTESTDNEMQIVFDKNQIQYGEDFHEPNYKKTDQNKVEEIKKLIDRPEYFITNLESKKSEVIKNDYVENKLKRQKEFYFSCNYCNKLFLNKCDLKQHVKIIHEGMSFTSELCDFKSSSKGAIPKRRKTIHEGYFEYLKSILPKRSNNVKLQIRYEWQKRKLFMLNLKRRKLKMKGRKEN